MKNDSDTASVNRSTHSSIGLDLDGCCDEHNPFFKTLSESWPGKVYVISYRSDRAKAVADLARLKIRYEELILVNSFEAKAEVLAAEGIMIFFDDQPEMLKSISPERTVMLVRNEAISISMTDGGFCRLKPASSFRSIFGRIRLVY